MRFGLQSKFHLVEDVRPVLDPWGTTWMVARADCAEAQALQRELQKTNPLFVRVMNAQLKTTIPAGVQGVSDEKRQEMLNAAIEAEVGKIDLRPEDLEALVGGDRDRALLIYARGWDAKYEDGSSVPFNEANVRAMFALPEWVPEGQPYGGQQLGAAVRAWLLQAAADGAAGRQHYLEAAIPNSEGSSAGVEVVSPSSTT